MDYKKQVISTRSAAWLLVVALVSFAISIIVNIDLTVERQRYHVLDSQFKDVLSGKVRPPYLWSLMEQENSTKEILTWDKGFTDAIMVMKVWLRDNNKNSVEDFLADYQRSRSNLIMEPRP